MRPEQAGEEQGRERNPDDEPRPEPKEPCGHEQERRDENVGGRERREEHRDEPPERMLVARVVDEVLRETGEPLVVEPELIGEPPGRAGAPPPRERDRVDVDEAEGRDGGGCP